MTITANIRDKPRFYFIFIFILFYLFFLYCPIWILLTVAHVPEGSGFWDAGAGDTNDPNCGSDWLDQS